MQFLASIQGLDPKLYAHWSWRSLGPRRAAKYCDASCCAGPDIRKVDLPEGRQVIPYVLVYLRAGILDGTLTPGTSQFG